MKRIVIAVLMLLVVGSVSARKEGAGFPFDPK